MEDIILEVNEISKYFGQIVANENISMSVKRGSVHSIIGENGAGKSTLMNMIAGIYKPSKGQITINGKQVLLKSPNDAARNGIGMVHQEFMLFPELTVLENLMLGSEEKKVWYLFKQKNCRSRD